MKRLIFFILVLLNSYLATQATLISKADSAYKCGNYQEATNLYERALKKGVSAEAFYNLGNAYFRLNDYPHAILNYERSLRINPSDEDANFNLTLCKTKLADHFDRPAEMFFITWTKELIQGHSADNWGKYGLAALAFCLIGFGIYYFASPLWLRKVGFTLFLLMLAMTVTCELFAFLQGRNYYNANKAVVMQKTAFTPDKADAPARHTIHEGTTVTILDESPDGQTQVELPDGQAGWLKGKNIEKIAQ